MSNKAAWITFGLAKLSGILGITLALMHHRTIGAAMLGVAFVFIIATAMICIRKIRKIPDQEFAVIARIPYPDR